MKYHEIQNIIEYRLFRNGKAKQKQNFIGHKTYVSYFGI